MEKYLDTKRNSCYKTSGSWIKHTFNVVHTGFAEVREISNTWYPTSYTNKSPRKVKPKKGTEIDAGCFELRENKK